MILRMPDDGWGKGIDARAWQARVLPVLLQHYSVQRPTPALGRGVTGSGKSILAAQFVACCVLDPNEVIVVSTPTRYLVRQLKKTFQNRLEGDSFFGPQIVGAYFTEEKSYHAKIIITCTKSLSELAAILRKLGKKVALWLCDECHGSEARTIKSAAIELAADRVLGMTATPYRTNKDESLTLFEKKLFDYSVADAISDKVVVPWRIVPWEGGEADLDCACIEMTELAIGPGLYNARTIPDANFFVHKAKDQGIILEAVHSKLPEAEIEKRLKTLQSGQLKAVTHVSMLQEGADFPWLYWLCLRRPVTSRTRFVQEIGRVLRAYTDPVTGVRKEEAVIYDPHDLFSNFKVTYEEVIGGEFIVDAPDSDDEEVSAAKILDRQLEQSVFDIMEALTQAKKSKGPISKTALAAYLGELVNGFDVAGLIDRKISSRDWRQQAVSAKQMQTIQNMIWTLTKKVVPPRHQRALTMLTQHGPSMNRGVASDLVTVMMSLADKKQWPTLQNLERAAEEGISRHEAQQAVKQKLITHGTMQAPPTPMTKPEAKTPQQIKKAAKEAEKKLPTLFE